jgi:hypothetical protein
MSEIDTAKIIKRLYSNLFIQEPFLEYNNLDSPEKLFNHLKLNSKIPFSNKTIEDVINENFELSKSSKAKRYKEYQDHSNKLLNYNFEQEFIPIFVNGLSVSQTNNKLQGRDPFSNENFFTTQLLELLEYPLEFLNNYRFVFINPVTYTLEFFSDGLRDVISGLEKKDNTSLKIGHSYYNPLLFSKKSLSAGSLKDLIEQEELGKEIEINQHIMAIKLATLIDKNYEKMLPLIKKYEYEGIPLYMEKSSDSAKIINLVKKYSNNELKFEFYGDGIFLGSKEKIPLGGISNSTAIRRFFGALKNDYVKWGGENKKINVLKIKERKMDYVSSEKYPGILIEKDLVGKEPSIINLMDKLTLRQQKYVLDFAQKNKIGFSRLEPRLVQLFTEDQEIYHGFRSQDKTNQRWLEEIKDKKIITPKELGLFETKAIQEKKGEFRGSELSLPGAPIINSKWLKNYDNGIIDVGCSLQKVVAKYNDPEFIKEIIAKMNPEEREEFNQTHDGLIPIAAERGTIIHDLSSLPLEGLVHYQTLNKIGLPTIPSTDYAEMPLFYNLKIKDLEFTASMHPDCLLFLEKDNKYDILILDTKTNRVTAYPEHKYIQQTYFYAWFVKEIVEKELGLEVNNFYTVLNKNSFHENFLGQEKETLPHFNFRPQKFSPIIKWDKEHYFHDIFPNLLHQIIKEKREINKNYDGGKYCQKCYLLQKKICEQLKSNVL